MSFVMGIIATILMEQEPSLRLPVQSSLLETVTGRRYMVPFRITNQEAAMAEIM